MKILLDTHALLWFVGGDARLSNRAREAIESPENEPWVSAVSVWEIGIKLSLGKLHLSMSLNEFIRDHVTGNGMALLGITPDHVSRIVSMPFNHRDPFDRLLIAQFPWFRNATIDSILKVEMPYPRHLYWPDLDIDLAVESIEHPERFPLVSKATN